MKIFVTGCAGFVGWKTTELLLREGHEITGLDNLNDYYDVTLKQARLAQLKDHERFTFFKVSLEDKEKVLSIFSGRVSNAPSHMVSKM